MEQTDNLIMSETQPLPQTPMPAKDIRLVDIAVTDENTSFNLIVQFVVLAQKRGAFSLEESAKLWECVKLFQKHV